MDTLREILGKRVRALREAHQMSQEELGKAAGLGGKYVGMIERAEKAASFNAVERLAEVFKVHGYELFVPLNTRSEAVEHHVKGLLTTTDRISPQGVEAFLKALMQALRKLERQSD